MLIKHIIKSLEKQTSRNHMSTIHASIRDSYRKTANPTKMSRKNLIKTLDNAYPNDKVNILEFMLI